MNIILIEGENCTSFKRLMTKEAYDHLTTQHDVLCLGAEIGGVAAGALSGYMSGDAFHIISLYVLPKYRRKNVATNLLYSLEFLLSKEASGVYVSFTVTDSDTESLCSFFENMEYVYEDHCGKNIYLSYTEGITDTLLKFEDQIKKTELGDLKLYRLDKLHEVDCRDIRDLAISKGLPMPEKGFLSDEVEADLSYVIYNDSELLGYCIIDRSVMTMPTISALWVKDGIPKVTAILLYRSLSAIYEQCRDEEFFAMTAVNDSSVALVKRHLPQAMGISYTYYNIIY